MKKLLLPIALFALISACSPEPEPIDYGEDMCEYCKMTIVDQQHAAELVTSKGKVFKFDAIECMINYEKDHAGTEFALYLVNDFLSPGQLVDATRSYYLISKAIPSPMGAYLTAFQQEREALKIKEAKGGEVYNWEKVRQRLEGWNGGVME